VPIRNILVLQVGQTPLVAGLPQGCRIFNIDECMYLFGNSKNKLTFGPQLIVPLLVFFTGDLSIFGGRIETGMP
jgi:hypothetical protein